MYDKNKIDDSLEFVSQISFYEKCDPEHIIDMVRKPVDIETLDNMVTSEHQSVATFDKPVLGSAENPVKGFIGDVLYIIICMIISLIVAYGITHFVAHHTRVDGHSMNNTLADNDLLIIEKLSYYFNEPERYDIVVFPFSDNINYIKRIIGLPGEKLQIINGYVYINDVLLEDDIYGRSIITDPGIAGQPVYIGENEYFVLGDNRNSSSDSRKESVGLINRKDIQGKAVFRFWPFDELGVLD